MSEKINLGDRVKDRISGFKGIAIGVTSTRYGCRQVVVQPETLNEGLPVEDRKFDEPQLEIIKPAALEDTRGMAKKKDPHGPRPAITRSRKAPSRR